MLDHRKGRGATGVRGRHMATGALVAAVAAMGIAPAADAAVKGSRSIEAAHSRDLVILTGYPKNKEVMVEVLRGGVLLGTTADSHYETDTTGFLEVNHVGGDCYDGNVSPDIRPGDTIRTTVGGAGGSDVDDMTVQNVTHEGAPTERIVTRTVPAVVDDLGNVITPEHTVEEHTGIFVATGFATTPAGVPLAGDVEFRLNHPSKDTWAATGRRDWRATGQAGPDGRYSIEFDTNDHPEDAPLIKDAALAALWLGSTSELSGYDDIGSACAPAPTSAITAVSQTLIGSAVQDITVSGPVQDGVTVSVAIKGPDGSTVAVDAAAVTQSGNGWSAVVPAANLPADGQYVITATFTGPGAPSPDARVVTVDRTAPAAPVLDLAAGAYAFPQTVSAFGEGEIRYTTNGDVPTTASPRWTGPLSVTTARTINAIAIDAAGNVSPVATATYTEKPAPVVVIPEPKPDPQPVVVDRPVDVVREIIREVAPTPVVPSAPVVQSASTPAPVRATPVVAAAAARIDRVTAPRRVKLAQARKGVAITVTTASRFIASKATRGAKVVAAGRTRTGHRLVFTAARRGTYTITLSVPGGARTVLTLTVR
jgi:hypothetical protein